MAKFFNSFIPKHISNNTVVRAYEVMRSFNRTFGKKFPINLSENTLKFNMHAQIVSAHNGYIEDQFRYNDMAYGCVTVKDSACEVIAVYNAYINLKAQGKLPADFVIPGFADLLSYFEKDGMARNGKFGTAPRALVDYFDKQGLDTVFSTKVSDFAKIAEEYDTLLYMMYNNGEDIMCAIHTVNISKSEAGYTGHNVDLSGAPIGPNPNFMDLISGFNRGKSKSICMLGVK